MKFEFDLNLTEKEIKDAFEPRLNAAVAATAAEVVQRGKELASQRLKAGLDIWEKGFKIDQVGDGFFVVTVTGKLAKMMEDGIRVGEISDMIMNGNRAKANKSGYTDKNTNQTVKKNYVDVPIGRNANDMGRISGRQVSVHAFKDADALRKHIAFSDAKKGGIKQEQRIIQRVEDVIKSTKPNTGTASYMTIRRVSDDSTWPASPFPGAKVLDTLGEEIEGIFDRVAAGMI